MSLPGGVLPGAMAQPPPPGVQDVRLLHPAAVPGAVPQHVPQHAAPQGGAPPPPPPPPGPQQPYQPPGVMPLALPAAPPAAGGAILTGLLSSLPTYDGEEGTPGHFFRRLDTVGELSGLTNEQKALAVHLRITGAAARYVQNTQGLVNSRDYEALKRGLTARFSQRENEGVLEKRFSACSQRPGERAAEYCDRLKEIGAHLLRAVLGSRPLHPDQQEAETAAHRHRVLRRFINGLRPEISRSVARNRPDTLPAALELAMDEEELLGGPGASGGMGLCASVDVRDLAALVAVEVAKLNSTQVAEATPAAPQQVQQAAPPAAVSPRSEIQELCSAMKEVLLQMPEGAVCYRCGQPGHIARVCTLYGAGAPGSRGSPSGRPNGRFGRSSYRNRGGGARAGESGGECHRCKSQGHWARDCPAPQPAHSGTPNGSRPQGTGAPGGQQ